MIQMRMVDTPGRLESINLQVTRITFKTWNTYMYTQPSRKSSIKHNYAFISQF